MRLLLVILVLVANRVPKQRVNTQSFGTRWMDMPNNQYWRQNDQKSNPISNNNKLLNGVDQQPYIDYSQKQPVSNSNIDNRISQNQFVDKQGYQSGQTSNQRMNRQNCRPYKQNCRPDRQNRKPDRQNRKPGKVQKQLLDRFASEADDFQKKLKDQYGEQFDNSFKQFDNKFDQQNYLDGEPINYVMKKGSNNDLFQENKRQSNDKQRYPVDKQIQGEFKQKYKDSFDDQNYLNGKLIKQTNKNYENGFTRMFYNHNDNGDKMIQQSVDDFNKHSSLYDQQLKKIERKRNQCARQLKCAKRRNRVDSRPTKQIVEDGYNNGQYLGLGQIVQSFEEPYAKNGKSINNNGRLTRSNLNRQIKQRLIDRFRQKQYKYPNSCFSNNRKHRTDRQIKHELKNPDQSYIYFDPNPNDYKKYVHSKTKDGKAISNSHQSFESNQYWDDINGKKHFSNRKLFTNNGNVLFDMFNKK